MEPIHAASAGVLGSFAFPKATPAFETQNALEVGRHMTKENRSRVEFNLDRECRFGGFRHAWLKLEQTTFDFFEIECSAGHEVVSRRPYRNEIFVFIPFRGTIELFQDRHRTEVSPGQIALVGSQGSLTQKRYCGEVELLVIQIPRQTLTAALADEYAATPSELLGCEPRIVTSLSAVPTLARYIDTLCRDAAAATPCIADRATARSCERTLILLLGQSFANGMGARIGGSRSPAAPFYVRRAQEFIQANAYRKISAAELTAAAGVSSRALYYGFQRSLGATPMKYLKRVRLQSARAALRRAAGKGTVTEIALAAGFGNLSRFCRDYRAEFGESPSATMRS